MNKRVVFVFSIIVALGLVLPAINAASTTSNHPLKEGDWFKYKVHFKASGGGEKIEGTVHIKYEVIKVDDNGFTVKITDISGDVDKYKEVFGDDIEKVGDTRTIPWDKDPSDGDIYADPSKLPKDGKVDITGGLIEGYAKYDTKTGIQKEGSGEANLFGFSISITVKLEDSNVVKGSGGGICGPAAIVGLGMIPVLMKKRRF